MQKQAYMSFFSIGYLEKSRVEVVLVDIPKSTPTDPYAWAKAQVKIDLDSFSGSSEIYLDISDMIRFKTELELMYKDVAGVAEFKTTENQLYVRLEMDNLGHVQASGFLSDSLAENKLRFEFSYDQTLLWHTISEINEALITIF